MDLHEQQADATAGFQERLVGLWPGERVQAGPCGTRARYTALSPAAAQSRPLFFCPYPGSQARTCSPSQKNRSATPRGCGTVRADKFLAAGQGGRGVLLGRKTAPGGPPSFPSSCLLPPPSSPLPPPSSLLPPPSSLLPPPSSLSSLSLLPLLPLPLLPPPSSSASASPAVSSRCLDGSSRSTLWKCCRSSCSVTRPTPAPQSDEERRGDTGEGARVCSGRGGDYIHI